MNANLGAYGQSRRCTGPDRCPSTLTRPTRLSREPRREARRDTQKIRLAHRPVSIVTSIAAGTFTCIADPRTGSASKEES